MELFITIDNFFRSGAATGAMIAIITTCVVQGYLLFYCATIIERWIQKNETSVLFNKQELSVTIKERTFVVEARKIQILFCNPINHL